VTTGRQHLAAGRRHLAAGWAAVTGTGGAASLTLALLVGVCVFVAVAGPRESLGLRTQALRATLAGQTRLAKSVDAGSSYSDFADSPALGGGTFPPDNVSLVRTELARRLARRGLPLAPAAQAWSGLTTQYEPVTGAARSAINGAVLPQLEVIYRDALGRNSRLLAGRLPATGTATALQIAVTAATAARFGLHPGSRLGAGLSASSGRPVSLVVTGVIRPVDPGSTFWTADPNAAAPTLNLKSGTLNLSSGWIGGAFVGRGEFAAMQSLGGIEGARLEWNYPLALGHLNADQASTLSSQLTRASFRDGLGLLFGQVNLTFQGGPAGILAQFLSTDAALASLLSLLFVSLTVIAAVVLLLGAVLLAEHRAGELALIRARGASRRQLAALTLAGGAAVALPAALAGAAAALLVTPGEPEPLAWWLAGLVLAVALAGPPLLAFRLPATAGEAGTRNLAAAAAPQASARRRVAELTAVALAAGGLVVLRQQGLSQAGGVDFYTSAAPVLLAVPAALIVMRLCPAAVRGLLHLAGRRRGVTAFVGLARAARAALAAILPAFALVLALTVIAFGFMIRSTVLRGQVAVSWQATGADAVISIGSSPALTPAARRSVAAAGGARQSAVVLLASATPTGGAPVDIALVDPASYAALTAGTPAPRFPAAALSAGPAGTAGWPVLASPGAAADLPRGGATLSSDVGPLRVRVARIIASTPAFPGSSRFIVAPMAAVRNLREFTPPALLLINGPKLNEQALAAATRHLIPGATISFRSTVLSALTRAPLPRGADVAFAQGSAAAGGLCVLILLLTLVLAARSRAMTLARLSTMGLGSGQARWLAVLEAMPIVVAATAGGLVCAWALVPILGPALNLSAFTGSSAGVPVQVYVPALVIPAIGLVVISVATLTIQAFIASRRGDARALRIGG
jgi:putative ABC transport system permease protein